MAFDYFSDRENGPNPRTSHEITPNAWHGLVRIINNGKGSHSFAEEFPETCFDEPYPICGTSFLQFDVALRAEIPNFDVGSIDPESDPPPLLIAVDYIEFCHRHISRASYSNFHSYGNHYHYIFDKKSREAGKREFREEINLILKRNGIAFIMTDMGKIERIAPPVLDEVLHSTFFRTSDRVLNDLLEIARTKFLNPDSKTRKEALEKLWDAWERCKTIFVGDKKSSVEMLLRAASNGSDEFFKRLDDEATALTKIGNDFQIRHFETNKYPIASDAHVDYLFYRLFTLIYLVLRDRIGSQGDEKGARQL
jgi:hypothetical protein